jgi:prepilin signal peptidase PulO-like enzyme (type II secretory pathway)
VIGWIYAHGKGKKISVWYLLGELYWGIIGYGTVYMMVEYNAGEMGMYFFGLLILAWWLLEADIRRYEVSWSMVLAAGLWILWRHSWWTYDGMASFWWMLVNYTVIGALFLWWCFFILWGVGKRMRRDRLGWGDVLVAILLGTQALRVWQRVMLVFPEMLTQWIPPVLYALQIVSVYCMIVAVCGLIYALMTRKQRIPFVPSLILWYVLLFGCVEYRVPFFLQ